MEWANDVKYLGVTIDCKLTFELQVMSVCQKLNRTQGALRALSGRLPRESMLAIYYALAYSHIVQSIIIWGGGFWNSGE